MAVSLLKIKAPSCDAVIVEAYKIPSNGTLGRYQATIMAVFDDGTLRDVVTFYDDELRFEPEEFVGKTAVGVTHLFAKRDGDYLRS